MIPESFQQYAEIIDIYSHGQYYAINFEKLLLKKFKSENLFLQDFDLNKVRRKYCLEKMVFKQKGIIRMFNFSQLKYYQVLVGITGPKNTYSNDPVFVIKIDQEFILYDGYHRILKAMIEGKTSIQGLYLTF